MNNEEPMTVRYLRRRKGHILLFLALISVTLYWTNYEFTSFLHDRQTNCNSPCFGVTCKTCDWNNSPVPSVNILDKLNLKQAIRSAYKSSLDFNRTDHLCKRPAFDLQHDSVRYAFHSMETLNCSRKAIFSVENSIFKIDKFVLKDSELEKCIYYGIERVTDDFHTYTEGYTKDKQPFDSLIIKQDFVRIKCFIKSLDTADDTEDDKAKLNDDTDVTIPVRNLQEENLKDVDSAVKIPARNLQEDKVVDEANNANPDNDDEVQYIPDDEKVDQYDEHHDHDDHDSYYDFMYQNMFEQESPDFDQLLVQVYPKSEVFRRISKHNRTPHENQMNVLVFGLDSMSHLAVRRKLPKTYQFLKDVLGSVILDGYNIVGDATTANLIPMLTVWLHTRIMSIGDDSRVLPKYVLVEKYDNCGGEKTADVIFVSSIPNGHSESELPETRKSKIDSEYVNVYPIIWNDFREAGYVTMFAEDEPTIGAFNLRLTGFDDQPTDHYMRPFWQALWDSEIHESSPRYCTGDKANHMFLLDYTKDFFVKYGNVSKFAFVFGSELTHWDNNPGEYMDEDFVNFLKFLNVKGYLNNTLLVFMADHGARYSRVRKTVQGKMEERLPMMSLTFPSWFRRRHPMLYRNLVRNSDHLTTPFDIYETLKDVLDPKRTTAPVSRTNRGLSLLSRIPPTRTCADARVLMHWCTCLQQLDLDITGSHAKHSAGEIIKVLNKETAGQRDKCAILKLKKVVSAYLLIPNEKVLMFQHSMGEDQRVANFSGNVNIDHAHFQITVETSPNRGLFEATIQANITAGSYTVMDDVNRLDRYGNQPACVQDKYPELRKFCYCNHGNVTQSRDSKRQGRVRSNGKH